MAASANHNPSATATAAAAPSLEELPVVEVFTTGVRVVVKWGEGGAKQTTAGLSDNYTNSFHALDSNGDEPLIKTFGTLLGCDGGVLTIGDISYRIQVRQQQQQQQQQQRQQQQLQGQHPKKIKTSFSLDRPEDALESVKAWAKANQPKNALDPRDACYPFKLKKTWKRDVMNESLREIRTTVMRTLTTDDDRGPLAIAVRHGLGNGKTHFLREAPSMLGQEKQSVYLTYNGDQNLAADAKEPGKCVLLRILFALFGTGHVGSSTFLLSNEANEWTRFDTSALVTLTVQCLEASLPEEATGFCVCVDELRKLEGVQGSLPDLLSTLGWLVKELHSSRRRLFCTVLVTALTTSVIKTVTQSGRTLESMKLPNAEQDAVDFICDLLTVDPESRWKVRAVAACHMRSIVVSSMFLGRGHSHCDIDALIRQTYMRLHVTITDADSDLVVDFVKRSCESGNIAADVPDDIEAVSTSAMAIPPAIMVTCLGRRNKQRADIAKHIFSNNIVLGAPKQLEEAAKQYDLLRATWRLNVIPHAITIAGAGTELAWFKGLQFPEITSVSKSSLFKQKKQGKSVIPVWAGLNIQKGVYYHPNVSNHAMIDRFFLAEGAGENSRIRDCLVMCQDKVNAAGFTGAVAGLNRAANLVQQNCDGLSVLCIVNVIGASERTRKQKEFEFPYALVRDAEVDGFYSTQFAPAIRFLRERWLKSLEEPEEE